MKLYVKITQRVPYFNIEIFKKPAKGRIAIEYSSKKLKKLSIQTLQSQNNDDDAIIAVNMYKWFIRYESLSFLGVLPYSNGGVLHTLVIKNRSTVERFLRDWI